MSRMTEREKEEWGFFLNPRTGRKNYNCLCKKCRNGCKQSFRATVVECKRFAPVWGRKKEPGP